MYESTSKLLRRLRHPESGQAFLRQCTDTPSAAQVLRDLLAQAGLSVSDWIAAADISRSYGYQILRGERNPGRDVLLRTALALFLSPEDTQRLLVAGGCGVLYPRVRRDAAVIFALNQKMGLPQAEELLLSLPEPGLYAGGD